MKATLLLSGGFDSPIAGHLMMNKGIEIIALHFSAEPFTDSSPEDKSRKLANLLGFKKLIVVDFGRHLAEIAKKCNHRYYYIISRRMMLRIAERIAEKEGCSFIITGENIGQVGSQTLSNMQVISRATRMPILRPVLCNDKAETIEFAKKIGTYELSSGPEMCSVLGPRHPATRSRLEFIENEEKRLDVSRIIEESLIHLKE